MSVSATPDISTPAGIVQVLARVPQLQILTPDDLSMLAQFALMRHLLRGMDLYIEGAPASSISVMVSSGVGEEEGRHPERQRRRTTSLVAVSETTSIDISYRVLD